ncbi:hypothetical protein LJK88_23515 [Paenibacillus sp. P26]|nr:hypothetical protein LJK88_23515 [Paenibacillus sp. P26]UUZ95520.1 hypothetical protein LJK87_14355 [Paenibacillus sp. P25]
MNKHVLKMKDRKVIGEGRGRIVFHHGKRHVMKIAKNAYGRRSNKTEVYLYEHCPASIRKYLGRIFEYGKGWVVMKKYTRKFPNHSKKYRQKLYRIKCKFKRYGILPFEIYSARYKTPNLSNLRLNRKGRIKVIDFGNFHIMRR